MASITSVISLFVLLAVSCYALPIEEGLATSTFQDELATGMTIVANESAINMRLISDDESTGLPILPKIQTPFEQGVEVITHSTLLKRGVEGITHSTPEESYAGVIVPHHVIYRTGGKGITHSPLDVEGITHSTLLKRGVQGITHSTLLKRGVEGITHSNVEEITHSTHGKLYEPITFSSRLVDEVQENVTFVPREVADDLFTTVETSTEFEGRTIRPGNVELIKASAVVLLNGTEVESTTVDEPTEETSSFTGFARSTGLLPENESEVFLTTEEILTTQLPTLIKTVAIIPGQITETKIYPNLPSKSVQPLSQGEKQPVVEKEESDH